VHQLGRKARQSQRRSLCASQGDESPCAGPIFRAVVLLAQGAYCNLFFLSYLVAPVYCHRLVGYLEEEAVKTYTHLVEDIDAGNVPEWEGEPVPPLAIKCAQAAACLPVQRCTVGVANDVIGRKWGELQRSVACVIS
jgi:Alternative oxidase